MHKEREKEREREREMAMYPSQDGLLKGAGSKGLGFKDTGMKGRQLLASEVGGDGGDGLEERRSVGERGEGRGDAG